MSKKALIILGGLRLGDCFHCIPILTKLKVDGFDDVTWCSGTYEEGVVRFLCKWYDFKPIIRFDGIPQDLDSRKLFLKTYEKDFNLEEYDCVFTDYKQTFEFEGWPAYKDYAYLYGFKRENIVDKVVVQPDTTSNFKRVLPVYDVNYKKYFKEVVSIGGPVDVLISDSTQVKGANWEQVFEQLKNAKLFVGLHSAVMCLAFYTGIPMIILFFWESLFSFKQFRPNIIELVSPKQTSVEQIEEAIVTLNK